MVIVAYGRYDLTDSCLRHLQAQSIGHRIVVVDNGSTDDTRARIRSEWPHVRLERFDDNRCFAKACNHGVSAGSGEVVVPLNNDVDVRPDFLERVLAPLERDPQVGAVATLMLQPGERVIDSAGLAADVTLG
ncbi:MAG TPA: glycosyltransferase, partial [Patescibacteria group bacterium]|nr:glycosyltransferase [Patescibacteria group bacterium]